MELSGQWQYLCHLMYSYFSVHQISQFTCLNFARWSHQCIQNPTKKSYETYFYLGGRSKDGGLISSYELILPYSNELSNKNIKPIITRHINMSLTSAPTAFLQVKQQPNKNSLLMFSTQKNILVFSTEDFLSTNQGIISNVPIPKLKITGNENEITCMIQKKDNLLIGAGKYIKIYNLEKGAIQSQHYQYHKDIIKGLSWSQMNEFNQFNFLSISLDGDIFIWDRRQYKPVRRIISYHGQNHSLESINNYTFLTGGRDSNVKFWDLRTQKSYLYKQHNATVNKIVKTSQLGTNRIAFCTASEDCTAILWEDKPNFIHAAHHNSVIDIDYHLEIQLILSIQHSSNQFMIWKSGIQQSNLKFQTKH